MDQLPDRDDKSQKYLGNRGLIVLIALLSAFVPLSTDLYLPALPGMGDYFGVSAGLTNLTLILFFLFFSLGMLFWGPLSDRYGRAGPSCSSGSPFTSPQVSGAPHRGISGT